MISMYWIQYCCDVVNKLPEQHGELDGVSRNLSKRVKATGKIYMVRKDGIKAIVDSKTDTIEFL